ncbi:MAG: glycosyltransferase family 2 protein [Deltaproteobacteria bacterium]|nr:glycosyltransferase family 2 protein [Deltaproteobacteria bacterium]
MRTLFIIPAFNEGKNIGRVIDDLREHVPEGDIVVMDDGSSDGTARVAEGRRVPVVSLPFNVGIGATMQAGYLYARRRGYDAAVQFDGDGQHCADQVAGLLRPVLEGAADIVVGSRFLDMRTHRPGWSRLVGIRILSAVVSALVGQRVTDPTSGFRAVNRPVIERFSESYPDDYPEPESLVLLHRWGFRLRETPVAMRDRLEGSSTITFVRGIYYMVKVVLAIFVDMMKPVTSGAGSGGAVGGEA